MHTAEICEQDELEGLRPLLFLLKTKVSQLEQENLEMKRTLSILAMSVQQMAKCNQDLISEVLARHE